MGDSQVKLTKQQVIRLNLYKQELYHEPTRSSQEDVLALVRKLGCVQLDTLQVVTRSHNLIFWSRMKQYEEEWFWELYDRRQIFESMVHALSVVPVEEYKYLRPHRVEEEEYRYLRLQEGETLGVDIYEQIRLADRPIAPKDLRTGDEPKRPKGEWYYSPLRRAFDGLWLSGKIGVTRNRQFNKLYETVEKRIPEPYLHEHATPEETHRHCALRALDAMGAATERDIADYYRLGRAAMRATLEQLVQEGVVIEVAVEEEKDRYFLQKEDLSLFESPVLAEEPTHSTLLSPFDNLIWHRPRLLALFGVDYKLECYTPEAQRRYGYFALPILLRGRIVGTVDLKTERKKGELVVKKVVLFDDDVQMSDVDEVLHRLMTFLKVSRKV
ncbi:MAG: crosslink repair DNA glycosylase YcaQ family protein [Tumebacillaceae bacterium]